MLYLYVNATELLYMLLEYWIFLICYGLVLCFQALYFCGPFREQLLEYYSNSKNQGESDENLLTCLAELFSQVISLVRNPLILCTISVLDIRLLFIYYCFIIYLNLLYASQACARQKNPSHMACMMVKLPILTFRWCSLVIGQFTNWIILMQISSQKKKTGVLAPKRFVQRLRKENDVFRGYMHQVCYW